MDPLDKFRIHMNRRAFLGQAAGGLGAAALASLLNPAKVLAAPPAGTATATGGQPGLPHFAPKAKRVIYLFMAGGPSHIDLFDYKPKLREIHGTELPDSIRNGQRITGMTSGQSSFPCVAPMFKFKRYGPAQTWMSEILPHISSIAGEIAVVKSVHTEAINHDPAITYIQTGTQQLGRPSIGSWLSYGLGSENKDLPAYIVFISLPSKKGADQPLFSRLWGSGFLPSNHQGVQFLSGSDPVVYLSNPPGVDPATRRRILDGLDKLNEIQAKRYADPEIDTRIAQYEMAFGMQTTVPDLMNLKDEKEETFEMYGPESRKPGTFARNCLLARRMAERGVRFIQLFHRGWDQHGNLPNDIRMQCEDTEQASAALVMDLKKRGMLDETLVVWGGEFGRTIYSQGTLTADNHGRDHHGRCFTTWLSGGGIKGGVEHGETDDYCYNIVKDPVHVHDFNATILHCLGINHEKLTFRFQGRDFRLTDVHGNVVKALLA